MKTLRICYRRFPGFSRVLVRPVPEGWAELTPAQFVLAARLYLRQVDEAEFVRRFLALPRRVSADAYYRYRLSCLLEFLGDCRVRLDRFILPSLGRLRAPGVRLKGITFEHFMLADTAFNRYVRDGLDASLDHFVSLLYLRPAEHVVLPPDAPKGLFSRPKVLDPVRRRKQLAREDRAAKYAVFLNYVFVRRWLSHSFPRLFPPDNGPDDRSDRRKPTAPQVNWLDIFDAFVGDDVAQMDKFRRMPATTAFRLLDKRIRNAQTKKR